MLATDLNNTEFAGAQNPDSQLYVEFYWHEPIDKWQSEVETARLGKRIIVKGPKQAYVRIMRPGDQTSIVETAVREDHKQRWPDKWMYWQMAEGLVEEGEGIPGWQIAEWPYLQDKPELMRELKFLRFHTVDQMAGASDAQVQKLGIGGPGLREQARVDLRERIGKQVNAQMVEKDRQIAEMQARMEKLEQLVMQAAQPAAPTEDNGEEWNKLAVDFTAKFERKPHPKMSIEKMREALGQ
jgi:hypothetical protein